MKWLAFLIFVSLLPSAFAIEITEVMSNPEGSDSGREWIEIQYDSLNLTKDWRLVEGGEPHLLKMIKNTNSSYAVIADDWEMFLLDYPDFDATLIDSSFSLKNTGEKISIVDGNETLNYIEYKNVEEGMSWCRDQGQCEPTPGKGQLTQEKVDEAGSIQCSPEIVEKEVYITEEKIVEREVEVKEILFYVDYEDNVEVEERLESTLLILNQFNKSIDIEVQSYIHNGSKLVSESYMNGWNGGWSGNKQNFTIEGESLEIIDLVNRVKEAGDYNLRLKVRYNNTEKDIDNPITITPRNITFQETEDEVTEERNPTTGFSIMALFRKLFNS